MTSTAPQKTRPNHHATVLRIGREGILIEGPSGSGKTSLALGLLEYCKAAGIDCALVSDDQTLLEARDGRLVATAPPTIAGQIELVHFGLINIAHEAECVVTRVFRLEGNPARMAEPEHVVLFSSELPLHRIPARHEAQARRIILYLLGFSAF